MTNVLKILHQIIVCEGIKNILYIFRWKWTSFHWTVFQVRHYLKANVHVKKLQWNFTGNQGSNSDISLFSFIQYLLAICTPMSNLVWEIYREVWKFESGKVWNFEMDNV